MRPGWWTGWRRTALVAVAVVAVAAGAALANLALLDSTGEDRLGRLRAVDPALGRGATTSTVAPPAVTTDGDDRGRGRGSDEGDGEGGRGRGRGGDDD